MEINPYIGLDYVQTALHTHYSDIMSNRISLY